MTLTDIYPPTPSQLRFAADHTARLERMGGRGKAETVSAPLPRPVGTVAPPVAAPDPNLAARQKEIWFSIVGDVEPLPAPPITTIQKICAGYFGVSVGDINSQRRTTYIVHVRMIAIWFTKEMTRHSYPEIGRRFGDRDHATAIHSFRKIERLRHTDAALQADLDILRLEIEKAIR